MKLKTHGRRRRFLRAAVALLILAVASARAGTITTSTNAPAITGDNIANLGLVDLGGETVTNNSAVTSTDKWFNDGSGKVATAAKGQTFLIGTGSDLLKSVTYQVAAGAGAAPTKTYVVRVGTISGTAFTPVYSEAFTQTNTWNQNDYVTWTFATPPLLNGDTLYGVDIAMVSSSSSWQSGIPYLNCTDNGYLGGQLYNSGSNGVGSATITPAIATDRIFHLALQPPTNSVFSFAAGNPPNGTNAVFNSVLVGTFSQNLALGSGNITIKNLTDSTTTNLPVSDARVTLAANLLQIATPGLITWNKQYAIQIDPGAFTGNGGTSFAGITDDATWNFTTAPVDPLLAPIAELQNHLLGVTNLTPAQITADSVAIESQVYRFAATTNIISAVFGLVHTYETVKGPLWTTTGTLVRSADTTTNLVWTIYHTMQGIMDTVYNTPTLGNYRPFLDGFKFNCSSNFPGPCPAPPTNQTYTVAINASFPTTFGRNTQGWTQPARRPTGAYLAPGTIATVTVPPALVGQGCQVRVGAHSFDMSSRPNIPRLDRASLLFPIVSTNTVVASPLGGGIYIEVPLGLNVGVTNITITGAARAPFFQSTSFNLMTAAQWLTSRTNVAPWADFQSDKFMMQVPRSWIYNFTNPVNLMSNWDLSMDACNDLMGFPHLRGKETMYYQVDLQLAHSVYAPGYPTINLSYNPTTDYGGNINQYLITGPQNAAQYTFHEEGHSYFFPKFGGESESTVNLLFVPVLNRKFGVSLDAAFRASYDYIGNGVPNNLDNAAVLWMTSFDFSPRAIEMQSWEKSYQPQGHAKYVDIARLYGESGWAGLGNFWQYYNSNDTYNVSYPADDDSLLIELCKTVGKDVRPLWHFWGVIPANPTNVAAQVAAAGLMPPAEIYDLLVHYKSLLPTNNASYQAWCLMWYGKQPSTSGYGVEIEHARQWSTNLLNGVCSCTQMRFPTEIYDENACTQVAARAQAIIDLYYPNGRPTLPVVPLWLTGVGTNALVKLTWGAATNATSYNLKRALLTGGPYSLITTTALTNYNDAAVTNGVTYYYVVSATNVFGESTNSVQASVTPTAPPVTPPILGVVGPLNGTSFPLSFSGPNGQTFAVLRSTNVALPLANWTVVTNGTFGGSPVTYTDIAATNQQQFYRVKSP